MTARISEDGYGVREGFRSQHPTIVTATKQHYSTKQAAKGGALLRMPPPPLEKTPAHLHDWLANYIATHTIPTPEPKRVVFAEPGETETGDVCIETDCPNPREKDPRNGAPRQRCCACRRRGERQRAAAAGRGPYKPRGRHLGPPPVKP